MPLTSATVRLGWQAETSSSRPRSTTPTRPSTSCAPPKARTRRSPVVPSWRLTGRARPGPPSYAISAEPSPSPPAPSSSPATPAAALHRLPPPWSYGTCRGPCQLLPRAVSSASPASSSPSSLAPPLLLTRFPFLISLRLNGSPLSRLPAGMLGEPTRCLRGVPRTRPACGLPRRMRLR